MSDKPKSEIKVTDRRIFTAEGEIREEFRQDIKPGDPFAAKPVAPAEDKPVEKAACSAIRMARNPRSTSPRRGR
jgi:hypothetical protein